MKLSKDLDNSGLTILPSPGDGHCLLHSVVSSYKNQLPHLPLLTIEGLKARIFIETANHLNEYTSFLVAPLNEPSYMMRQLRVYLESKIYNHDFGDLIPRVIANSLFVSVHILDEIGGEISSKEIEPTVFAQNTLVVHRNGDHYNGVRPITPRSIPNFSVDRKFSYSRKQLLSINYHVPRTIRKRLFELYIWRPKESGKPIVNRLHRHQTVWFEHRYNKTQIG